MENKVSYYAIIPAEVRYNKNLTANAKLLYGEITALCNKKGYCWSENNYFSELYGVSKTSVSIWISSLKKEELIEVVINHKDKDKHTRKIYLNTCLRKLKHPIKKSYISHKENLNTPKPDIPLNKPKNSKKSPSNNTLNTTINISKEDIRKPKKVYGNPSINYIISSLKGINKSATLDGTVKDNRQFAHLLVKNKIKPELQKSKPDLDPPDKQVKLALRKFFEYLCRDEFHKRNATSVRYLYNNFLKIINNK